MKRLFVPFVSMMFLALSTVAWSAEHTPQDLPLVTGEHWTTADPTQKPVLLNGLSGVGIPDLVAQLDTYYAGNPEQLKRPVLEVLYIEMALPRMKR